MRATEAQGISATRQVATRQQPTRHGVPRMRGRLGPAFAGVAPPPRASGDRQCVTRSAGGLASTMATGQRKASRVLRRKRRIRRHQRRRQHERRRQWRIRWHERGRCGRQRGRCRRQRWRRSMRPAGAEPVPGLHVPKLLLPVRLLHRRLRLSGHHAVRCRHQLSRERVLSAEHLPERHRRVRRPGLDVHAAREQPLSVHSRDRLPCL